MKKRCKSYKPKAPRPSPIEVAFVKREVIETVARLRAGMGIHAFMGNDVSRICGSAGRLFFIVAHAANAKGYGNSQEGNIIAGAASALGDIAEIPERLEQQRGAIISGLAAVDRLLPNLDFLSLRNGVNAFADLLEATNELRTEDVRALLFGEAA